MTPIELPNGYQIGPGAPCFVTAEIGQNHQGNVYTAIRLLKAAHDAGVDGVKFCKRNIREDLSSLAYQQPYDNPHSFGPTYGKHREALELSIADYIHIKDRMRYNSWPEVLFATACDQISAMELEKHIRPPMYKIASRDIDNEPLIDHVASLGKPVILSTGMEMGPAMDRAVKIVRAQGAQVIILYCVSEYPTPLAHIDLSVIPEMQEVYGCPIGFSDHTPGIVAAQAAALLGAVMVEKHLTLARAMKGTDHAASLEPEGMKRLVRNIRIGEALQQPVEGEDLITRRHTVADNRRKLGRSLTARETIHPGTILTEDMLCLKSPGTGLAWHDRGCVIGHRAKEMILEDTLINEDDVEICETAEATV